MKNLSLRLGYWLDTAPMWAVGGLVFLAAFLLSVAVVVPGSHETEIGAAGSIFVAAGTLVLAIVTYRATKESRGQFKESQKMFEETERAQYRPLLVPANTLGLDDKQPMMRQDWQSFWTGSTHPFQLKNVGLGVAPDACGAILPPKEEGVTWAPMNQYFVRLNVPIAKDEVSSTEFETGNTIFTGDNHISNVPMGVPTDRAPNARMSSADRRDRVELRMTLSYRDIYLHRHATVFDLTPRLHWVCVAVLSDIEKDILDMDEEKRTENPMTALDHLIGMSLSKEAKEGQDLT